MSIGQILKAWLIILPFMIANGIFRELVVKRFVSTELAEVVSVSLGMVILVVLTRFLLRPLSGKATSDLVRASATLVVLTVAFEFLFGHYVDRKSWPELVANYEIWNGRFWPVALATLAFMPFVWGRWSIEEKRHARQ